ncbi:MAG: Nif11-like leader peptide family natural product precursor [Nostoc sp.]|uniref:Nif11-like leader peptide family natural product precursor n=1 Tax=Nostoc sp. TaxID=1180 RepID=UPI002FF60A54
MSIENVQAFYVRVANDETFRAQLQEIPSKDEANRIVNDAGYDFTQEEFEEYTAQLLESSTSEGELRDLNEKELETVFGGFTGKNNPQSSCFKWWLSHKPQPVYGVVQPLYGVIVQPENGIVA